MLPVIVLVGRPNVGKSTLFNRLTRSRDALVADQPGLTRDRKYGLSKLGAGTCMIVDTGGLAGATEGPEVLSEQQTALAIAEADHIILLGDAKDGCTVLDQQLAERLRRTGKPLTAVVNKVDGRDPDLVSSEFHSLGLGHPVAISASHGYGVEELIDSILADISQATTAVTPPPPGILVAVVGRPNVGKSTLINRLLGEERLITYDQPGTTRDSQFIPLQRGDNVYTLIDTAGVRRRGRVAEVIEKFSIIKTLQAIEQANVVLLLLDAQAGITDQDAGLAGHILETGRAVIVVVNKWDGLSNNARSQLRSEAARRLGFLDFAAWHYISALHGSGVGLLLAAVDKTYANANRDLSTPELNRLLAQAVLQHSPPLVHGRRIKLRYAHQGGRNPPVIVIHGNQTEALPDSYGRYLTNYLRQQLQLTGTPIRLVFKTATNPYQGQRNKLTPRQIKKRQRLREFSKHD